MPRAKSSKSRINTARAAPYLASKPEDDNDSADKENASPKDSASPAATPTPASYLDIELEEVAGHWGDFEATVIRRKLNALINNKAKIPGSNQCFNKTNLSKELCKIAQSYGPIESSASTRSEGPSVHAITTFLKKSGSMGGGDSQTFYYGTMLLEKLRIWNGEKKTKAREKAEEDFPTGHRRIDPATAKLIFSRKNIPTRTDVANFPR